MGKAQYVFARQEKKYLLNNIQYAKLKNIISQYICEDNYAEYTICNLYFDTDDYRIIRDSIEKPVYKEKLRLRSYGTAAKDSTVFWELKKKFKGIVYKRRIALTLSEYEDYMLKGNELHSSKQIQREIEWFMKMYNPVPKVFLAYDREAFHAKDDKNLRITFDTNIRYRFDNLVLDYNDSGKQLLPDDVFLLEIKAIGSFPIWLADALCNVEAYPTSFSKYGSIYTKSITNLIGGSNYA